MAEIGTRKYYGERFLVFRKGENVWDNASLGRAYCSEIRHMLRRIKPSRDDYLEALADGRALPMTCGMPVYHSVLWLEDKELKAIGLQTVGDNNRLKGLVAIVTMYSNSENGHDANTSGTLQLGQAFEAELLKRGFCTERYHTLVDAEKTPAGKLR